MGDIISNKPIAKAFDGDSIAFVYLLTAKKAGGMDAIKYIRKIYANDGKLLGQVTIGYIKYNELDQFIGDFERKNYKTNFNTQVKQKGSI